MAHPGTSAWELPAWKNIGSHIAAAAVAILFLTAGVWKITDPFTWRTMAEQLLVPVAFSLPLTLALAVSETFAGVLVLVPRFRRWGAWLVGLLLVVFMIYVGWNYSALLGKECSCFPWVKRTVGPGFFYGDAVMLALAGLAGWWARPSEGTRSAAVVLGAVVVFMGVSFGVAATHQSGIKAPNQITVDGQPYSLEHGLIFLYFYDPQCSHCEAAAKTMSKFNWKDTVRIGIPTRMPNFAESFLADTKFNAKTSLDFEVLKKTFPFGDPPYGVVLQNGRSNGLISQFDADEPAATLRKLGAIE